MRRVDFHQVDDQLSLENFIFILLNTLQRHRVVDVEERIDRFRLIVDDSRSNFWVALERDDIARCWGEYALVSANIQSFHIDAELCDLVAAPVANIPLDVVESVIQTALESNELHGPHGRDHSELAPTLYPVLMVDPEARLALQHEE